MKICIAVLCSAGLVRIYLHYSSYLRYHYERWRYPPIESGNTRLSADIAKEIEARNRSEVVRAYRRVLDLLEAAAAEGLAVGHLQKKMPRVARLISERKYRFAQIHLNTIYVRIPRKREGIRLPEDDVAVEDIFPELSESLVPRDGRSRRGSRR
ncbi:MAG: hypothetical protein ABII00_15780 [Elusimicrobiota bacterium]